MVRVVGNDVTVKSRPSRMADTLAKPQADTVLEVLDKEGPWFWVLITRDVHGTQRAGWVKESDVEFVDKAAARFFLPPAPIPVRDEAIPAEVAADAAPIEETAAVPAEALPPAEADANVPAAVKLQAEVKVPAAEAKAERVEKVAKVEKPKKVDDRKLKKAAADYEKALQAYEKLQFSQLSSLLPVGEPIIEPLYSLPN
jgi:uncharacterized protein YgiM (DUF1202 family)